MGRYIVSIGNEGYEGLLDISAAEREDEEMMIQKLQSPDPENFKFKSKINHQLQVLFLRSRFNSHRNIKHYVVIWEESPESLRDFVESNPRKFVKLMNKKKNKPVSI